MVADVTDPCPTCGATPHTIVVELGTYKRKNAAGWRLRVTDPKGDPITEAEVAGHIAGILRSVFEDIRAAKADAGRSADAVNSAAVTVNRGE